MCGFCIQNSDLWTRMTILYEFQPPSVLFFMQNSDFMTRLTILYGSQTSSVVLSTHNSVLSTRIKRLYGFQPSPVVLCMQNSDFSIWITSLYLSQPSSVVFAGNTACLASELLVSMGPSPHVRFFDAKQRLLYQNNKSLWVPRHHPSFCGCNTAWLAPE